MTIQIYGARLYVGTSGLKRYSVRIYDFGWSDSMLISERIFKILKDKNMSQSAFAKQVGLAGSTVSDWKRKKTNPSADKIMDICMVLEVTPEQLLTGKDIDEDYVEFKPKRAKADVGISKADSRILADIYGLKQEQRRRLMKYMEALKCVEALEDMK